MKIMNLISDLVVKIMVNESIGIDEAISIVSNIHSKDMEEATKIYEEKKLPGLKEYIKTKTN